MGWLIAALVAAMRSGSDTPGAGDDDGGEGGNLRPGTPPHAPCGAGDPAWWPQFERDFANYAQSAGRPRRATFAG